MPWRWAVVARLDVGGGAAVAVDGVEEDLAQEVSLHVVAVGLLELGVFVDGFVAGGRIEGPAVLPADVEDAFGSVEVDADAGFFGGVAGELAILPGAGEFVEVVNDGLMIGRVAGHALAIVDRHAADRAAAGTGEKCGAWDILRR